LLGLPAYSRRYHLLLSTSGELSRGSSFDGPGTIRLAYINYPIFWTRADRRVAAGLLDRGPLGSRLRPLPQAAARSMGIDRMNVQTFVMANSARTAQHKAALYPDLRAIHVLYAPTPSPVIPTTKSTRPCGTRSI
jgi:hypothetical protein